MRFPAVRALRRKAFRAQHCPPCGAGGWERAQHWLPQGGRDGGREGGRERSGTPHPGTRIGEWPFHTSLLCTSFFQLFREVRIMKGLNHPNIGKPAGSPGGVRLPPDPQQLWRTWGSRAARIRASGRRGAGIQQQACPHPQPRLGPGRELLVCVLRFSSQRISKRLTRTGHLKPSVPSRTPQFARGRQPLPLSWGEGAPGCHRACQGEAALNRASLGCSEALRGDRDGEDPLPGDGVCQRR